MRNHLNIHKFYSVREYSDLVPIQTIDDVPVVSTEIVTRKNQAQMTDEEKGIFKEVIETLNSSGFFGSHVSNHADSTHRMHGSMAGNIGFERFLPWHRIFLSRLGAAMRTVHSDAFIPYWDWTVNTDFPDWLVDFMPLVERPSRPALQVTRSVGVCQCAKPSFVREYR